MEIFKKTIRIVMMVLFPLGIIYCVGKNLFSGNFASFMGGVFLFVLGFVVSVCWLRPDIFQSIISFFGG